jgi:predicted Rossmann fold nucleotide-binding protein DprA/Smf involved in DNA uptake
MASNDIVQRSINDIRQRLSELNPLLEERDRLRAALEALEGTDADGKTQKSPATSKTRRRRSTTSRRARRGERRQQLLELLGREPGLRPSEAARRMGVAAPQLQSLAKRLEEEGALERREGLLYPRA